MRQSGLSRCFLGLTAQKFYRSGKLSYSRDAKMQHPVLSEYNEIFSEIPMAATRRFAGAIPAPQVAYFAGLPDSSPKLSNE